MCREKYFSGNDFRSAKAVLEGSSLFSGVAGAIDDAIKLGSIECHEQGTSIIEQDDRNKDVYIILEGEFDIVVNGRGVATRGSSDVLGEMSILDPSSKRSATVTALEDSVVLHIDDISFTGLADSNPRVWRNIAAEISRRLRQRSELVDSKGTTPRLFIGSSGEYLDVAYAIQEGLMRKDIIINVWSQDCFRPASGTLQSLENEATKCDMALFLFGNEDLIISRGEESDAPRDNVVFELGLFMGRLSTDRVFFAKEIDVDLKMPSDLYGITPVDYRRKPGEDLSISVQPICNQISKFADELGTK